MENYSPHSRPEIVLEMERINKRICSIESTGHILEEALNKLGKGYVCSLGEISKRPFNQDFYDKALLIFSGRICFSGESLPFYWHYSNDMRYKKRSQFRSMPSLDDRVGESPNEINAESWSQFFFQYILSP